MLLDKAASGPPSFKGVPKYTSLPQGKWQAHIAKENCRMGNIVAATFGDYNLPQPALWAQQFLSLPHAKYAHSSPKSPESHRSTASAQDPRSYH